MTRAEHEIMKKMQQALQEISNALVGQESLLKDMSGRQLHCLEEKVDRIMSAISDYADKQNAHNAVIDAAVDGLVVDVQAMKDMIIQLQNNPGPISAADQALLDQLEAKSKTTAEKLAALDALTPPVAPPIP